MSMPHSEALILAATDRWSPSDTGPPFSQTLEGAVGSPGSVPAGFSASAFTFSQDALSQQSLRHTAPNPAASHALRQVSWKGPATWVAGSQPPAEFTVCVAPGCGASPLVPRMDCLHETDEMRSGRMTIADPGEPLLGKG